LPTLGLVGSIIGGLIAQLFGTGSIWELNVIGFGLAVIAAVLLVGTAEAVVGKPPSRVICSVGPSGSTGAEAAERVASGVWSGVADVADAVAAGAAGQDEGREGRGREAGGKAHESPKGSARRARAEAPARWPGRR
jgi:hypothetical protein